MTKWGYSRDTKLTPYWKADPGGQQIVKQWQWYPGASAEQVLGRRCVCVLSGEWCPTLCDSLDCSLLGSSVHGIFQVILE